MLRPRKTSLEGPSDSFGCIDVFGSLVSHIGVTGLRTRFWWHTTLRLRHFCCPTPHTSTPNLGGTQPLLQMHCRSLLPLLGLFNLQIRSRSSLTNLGGTRRLWQTGCSHSTFEGTSSSSTPSTCMTIRKAWGTPHSGR